MHFILANLLRRPIHLGLSGSALHQDEFTAISEQGSGEGEELAERAHRAGGHLVECNIQADVFGTGSDHIHVGEAELRDLLVEPGDATLHRLDENERDIRTRDSEYQARESGAAPDVPDTSSAEEGSDDCAVQDVAGPQTGEFERTDKSTLFTLRSQVGREPAGHLNLRTEKTSGGSRLDFEGVIHREPHRST
ncbi:hypothetical protein ASE16_15750 [Leifsonia sp. Root227]|nr:hypothetical protein ASE16_15750 [Leifsonia sp. Root227]